MLRSVGVALLVLLGVGSGSETPGEACLTALNGLEECPLSDLSTADALEAACSDECTAKLQTVLTDCPPEVAGGLQGLADVCAGAACSVPVLRLQEECDPDAPPSVQTTCTPACLAVYAEVEQSCPAGAADEAIDGAAQLRSYCANAGCFEGIDAVDAACGFDAELDEAAVCSPACTAAVAQTLAECDPQTLPDEALDEIPNLEFAQGVCASPECRSSFFYVTENCAPDLLDPSVLCTAACFERVRAAEQHCPTQGVGEDIRNAYELCNNIRCDADTKCPTGLECSCSSSRRLLFSTSAECLCLLP